jgi:hypothetical protein
LVPRFLNQKVSDLCTSWAEALVLILFVDTTQLSHCHIPVHAAESRLAVAHFPVAIHVSVWGREIPRSSIASSSPSPSCCTITLLIIQLLMGTFNFTVGHHESVSSWYFERRWPICYM